MSENYGDWHERELREYADEQRERDLEWVEWEAEQHRDRLARDDPTKSREAAA